MPPPTTTTVATASGCWLAALTGLARLEAWAELACALRCCTHLAIQLTSTDEAALAACLVGRGEKEDDSSLSTSPPSCAVARSVDVLKCAALLPHDRVWRPALSSAVESLSALLVIHRSSWTPTTSGSGVSGVGAAGDDIEAHKLEQLFDLEAAVLLVASGGLSLVCGSGQGGGGSAVVERLVFNRLAAPLASSREMAPSAAVAAMMAVVVVVVDSPRGEQAAAGVSSHTLHVLPPSPTHGTSEGMSEGVSMALLVAASLACLGRVTEAASLLGAASVRSTPRALRSANGAEELLKAQLQALRVLGQTPPPPFVPLVLPSHTRLQEEQQLQQQRQRRQPGVWSRLAERALMSIGP